MSEMLAKNHLETNSAVCQPHLSTTIQAWYRLQRLIRDGVIKIDGTKLDIPGVVAVAYHNCTPKITEDPSVLEDIDASIQILKEHLDDGYSVYGVNTGFGGSADSRTDKVVALQSSLLQLTQAGVLLESDKSDNQGTLLDSHAMPASWVRGTMVVRCNSNLRGHSAVKLPILQTMVQLIQHRVTPIVPLRGSISASGDLMPLSYIAGTIEGNPDVYVQVDGPDKLRVMKSNDGLQHVGMKAEKLGPKEGLGLINGTSTSAAVASLALYETHQLSVLVQALSAMGLEALIGTTESYHPFISAVRPHDGQIECANNLLSLLQGSKLAQNLNGKKDQDRPGLVQDRYSFRCVPQWIGPQLEDLLLAHRQVTTELNSTCDNPLVDVKSRNIFSGGNFQAVSITSAMEKTRLCLQMLGRLIFSQATEMIDPSLNNGLPTNLVADDPSLSFTMKGVDISMASYMAELGYLSNPVSSHVQSAEMRNQAINSMALVSARYSMQAVEVLSLMCACDLYIACQALDLRALHFAFLGNAKFQLRSVTKSIFSKYLPQYALAGLHEFLDQHLTQSWPTTNRLSPADRVHTVIENAIPVLLDSLKSHQGPGLTDLDMWKTQACDLLNVVYQETADEFFLEQHTAELLGDGSKLLYKTVRQELGVPFHQGFIEHPTVGGETLNGRVKKTIGSWIAIIYEALRDGRLMGPLIQTLASTGSRGKMPAKRKRPVIETLASTRRRRYPRRPAPEIESGLEPGPEAQLERETKVRPESGVEAGPQPELQLEARAQSHDDSGNIIRHNSDNGQDSIQRQPKPEQNMFEVEDNINCPSIAERPSLIVVLRVRVPPCSSEPQSQPSQKPQDASVENVESSSGGKTIIKLRIKRSQPPESENAPIVVKKLRRSPRHQPPDEETQIEITEGGQDEGKADANIKDMEINAPTTSSNTVIAPPEPEIQIKITDGGQDEDKADVNIDDMEMDASTMSLTTVVAPPDAEIQIKITEAGQDEAKADSNIEGMEIDTSTTSLSTIVVPPEAETQIKITEAGQDEANTNADGEDMEIDTATTASASVETTSSPTTVTPTRQLAIVVPIDDIKHNDSSPKDKPVEQPQSRPDSEALLLDGDLSEQARTDPDPNTPELVRSLPYSGRRRPHTQLAHHLPPLHKLSDVFESLTRRAMDLRLGDVLDHLSTRRLRVATVCSGTESPLLALEMVKDNLKKYFNRDLDFDHLFSAEIVPFKQAYIERNFRPRLLFRDVAELQNPLAQTAYGSLEEVPKNADILIAGFSCVDFSGLNNYQKTLDEKGESGDTFWGIVCYAKAYRPRMVILENVKTAPWAKIEEHWRDIDYIAVHMNVDTKAYYLPQTRERGYMFCVDSRSLPDIAGNQLGAGMRQTWKDILEQFKRPASSPTGMFLLDADDRRLEQIERNMAQKLAASAASARATVNWDLYQVRHQGYRLKNGLGHRRPISKWQDDGTCNMPDFAWQTWVRSLPERVWDTIDANFLRKLVDGYDMNYKERCLELSQGIDREMDSRAFGIVGCITPCGIPYMTTRGGPLCGLESLALQGLPLDRLLLTQESQRELQDLAGNAMSSTVVGAAILSALIAGYKVLEPKLLEQDNSLQESKSDHQGWKLKPHDKDNLIPSNMYLDSDTTVGILKLQEQATSSARYCTCEGQSSIRTAILKCSLCSHTACSECSGNPQHAYKRYTDLVRTPPLDFVSMLRSILPARLVVRGITPESYKELRSNSRISTETWSVFLDAVSKAVGDELRIFDIKRSETWTVTYEGKYSVLKLVIDSIGSITWLLFAKPGENEPALCLIREVLSKPIARMVVPSVQSPGSILKGGTWEICTPLSSSCSLEFFGSGFQIDSYEAKCGLQLDGFQGTRVWSHITVQGTEKDVGDLEVDVRGTYELLQDCGTANACLHRRTPADGKPAIYLFLDPTKLGEPKHDSFVFALEHRRNPGYAARMSIAEVCHEWRSAKASDTAEIVTVYHRKWIACPTTSLQSYAGESNRFIQCHSLDPRTSFSITDDSVASRCHTANTTLLRFTIPADVIAPNSSSSTVTDWEVTNPLESPELLREHAWLFQKAAGYSDFEAWGQIANPSIHGPCMTCVPPKPRIIWGRDAKLRIKAFEDPHDAARYERAIKTRPPAFLIFRKNCNQNAASGLAELRVTLNIQTLLHQAFSRLPDISPQAPATFHWRLVPNSYDVRGNPYPKFELRSNRNDALYPQPPKFENNQLRPEQLRSLSWMVAQEGEDVEPFIEEETEEALLGSLMWRAEGKVTVPKIVRGGILADDVGYGKTAIVLGLIDVLSKKPDVDLSAGLNGAGFIPSRATLIVVPRIMVEQWLDEITKFLGHKYDVLAFSSAAALRKTSIQKIRNADIILVSWSIFDTQAYYKHLQKYTGASEVPDKPGRNFNDWFHHAHKLMKHHAGALTKFGPASFLHALRESRARTEDPDEIHRFAPSKRLRGKQYALAHKDRDIRSNDGVQDAQIPNGNKSADASDGEHENSTVLEAKIDDLPMETALHDEETFWPEQTCDDGKYFGIDGKPQSWEDVLGLPFHAFHFNRLVIDEFTYAKTDRLTQLLTLQARSKWVLSGTPPLNDFADVNTIAPFLGVHLGIDADDDNSSQNFRLKEIRKHRSDAETFESFRAPRSEAWHRRRHEIAQTFLNRFARKNVAEIDEIPSTEHIVLVRQSPAEKVIYLELYKQLMTYNRQLKRANGRGGDQAERLDEIIANSSTPEEALLKRCTSLALQGRWDSKGNPEIATCASLIETREEQLDQTTETLKKKLKLATWLYCSGCDEDHEKFKQFRESVIAHNFGDKPVTEEVLVLLNTAIEGSEPHDWKSFYSASGVDSETNKEDQDAEVGRNRNDVEEEEEEDDEEHEPAPKAKGRGQRKARPKRVVRPKPKPKSKPKPKAKSQPKGKDKLLLPAKPTQPREFDSELRDATANLRKLVSEWVQRKRALRFLTAVRQIQTNQGIPTCDNCQTQPGLLSKLNILGSCGHALCANSNCTQLTLEKEECAVDGCRGSGKSFNVISAMTLGCDTSSQNGIGDADHVSKHGGTKLDALVDILTNRVPITERALLFIQFPDLMEIASKALTSAGISHTLITPTDLKASSKVQKFQKEGFGDSKVLILNLGGEMAAGLNLQCANHIIFLSPLLSQTQYDYDSAMIQAVGRSRRYGQTKHVHVYHLLAKMTIDVNIFQERRGNQVLVERDGQAVFVDPEDALTEEAMTCQGPTMVADHAV
ncbi:putative SNF2 family helicase [Aspergillus mulundensis]|uniref:Helicase C-terminal domain-containing protein n=1 Tax=Aspergillus mulundensis TaxID=1810919 RepID=A0A3D8SWF2_9EURO|nr:hypothetical protein DSM5745_02364 [Aspergillus mulundensis]RDW90589.1 hypothetical protein DSM5745_02364 [Aspergillus mulundensis]